MDWQNINQYLVKEHVGAFKAANNFDVFDLQSGTQVLKCREPNLGRLTRFFRYTSYKRNTPFDIEITDMNDELILRVHRDMTAFGMEDVHVHDSDDQAIGTFKRKMMSLSGSFVALDKAGEEAFTLKGKWTGWEFRFLNRSEVELAKVSKKWAGAGKEFFTSADNYVLEVSGLVSHGSELKKLLLASVMCIDMVLKE